MALPSLSLSRDTPVFAGFFGVLDGAGNGTAQLNLGVQSPALAGAVMHYACVLLFDTASNPVAVEFVNW